jgi:Tfp pilus assembly protein PilF
MSVILDALKRVQDENRQGPDLGPNAGPAREPLHQPDDAALLRRLSGPSAPGEDHVSTAAISNGARMGLLLLSLVAIVAIAAWVFQPSFGYSGVDNGRPLLSELTGAPRPVTTRPQVEQPNAGSVESLPSDLASQPDFDEGSLLASATEAAYQEPSAPAGWGGQNYSDLSGNLPALDSAPAQGQAPTSGGAETMASANGGGFIDLSSQYTAPTETRNAQDEVVVIDPAIERVEDPKALVDPGVRAAFQDGVRMQKTGDMAGAEQAYKRALRFDPYNAAANANLGVLYESQSRLSLAERHLRAAVEVAPDNASAHNNLGVVLYRVGNYDGALIEFNRTLALDADRLDAYTNKGLIFTRWGRHEDAERAFLQVLARDPEHGLARYNLGLVYEETGQVARAVEEYYEFLSTGGSDHPEIVDYLSEHLPWLEELLDGGQTGGVR